MAQPGTQRFQWEVDTALTSIRAVTDMPVVLLFANYDHSVPGHFQDRYPNVEIHYYEDERANKTYPATTRPYLMWRYLSEDPAREKETYFQIDSDVIFREWPDLTSLDFSSKSLYGSDCGGYIDYNYLITRKHGPRIIQEFTSILGVDEQLIKDTPGVGAQWVYNEPTAELWQHILEDCDRLYLALLNLESDVQEWTAEMWSQLYHFAKAGYKVEITPELDFCRPTDDIKMWGMVKLLHNAGVVGAQGVGMFYKGKYIEESPFNEDLSWVRRDRASWHYARAIDKAAGKQ